MASVLLEVERLALERRDGMDSGNREERGSV